MTKRKHWHLLEMRAFVTTLDGNGLPRKRGEVRSRGKQTYDVKIVKFLLPVNEGAINY